MKSETFKRESFKEFYGDWLAAATAEQIEFVDTVYEMAEKNYDRGGHWIVECYEPKEIIEDFKTLDEAREQCGYHNEAALNARQGEDTDPELAAYDRFKEWE